MKNKFTARFSAALLHFYFSKIFFAALIGFCINWLFKEKLTLLLFTNKGFAGRNLGFKLGLTCLYTAIFGLSIYLILCLLESIFPERAKQIDQQIKGLFERSRFFITAHTRNFLVGFGSLFLLTILAILSSQVLSAPDGQLLSPNLGPVIVLILVLLFLFPIVLLTNQFSESASFNQFKQRLAHFIQPSSGLLIFVFSAAIIYAIFGKLLGAKWGVIDDHEIIFFLGRDGKLPLNEFLSALKLTEIGNFGSFPRYRPTYWILRLLECVLWGAHPEYWYAFRMVIMTLGMGLLWSMVSKRFGWLAGGVLSAYILTFFFWPGIVGRLGPNETYVIVGLPIYIWGFTTALQSNLSKSKYIFACLAFLCGTILCVGSKENLIILVFPCIYMLYAAFKQRKTLLWVLALASVLFTIYVAIAVLILVSQIGTDQYNVSINIGSRISAIFNSITSIAFNPLFVLGGIFIALVVLFFVLKRFTRLNKPLQQAIFWFGVLFLFCLSQVYFYNGVWPTNMRYDFPGMMYVPLAIYILYLLAEKIITEVSSIKFSRLVTRSAFILAMCVLIGLRGYTPLSQVLDRNVIKTNAFTNQIEEISTILKQQPEDALVIESGSIADYEPVFSYEKFLRAYGVDNPIFVRMHGYSEQTVSSAREKLLVNDLNNYSLQGKGLFLPLSFLPDYANHCFSLNLSGAVGTGCSSLPQ